MKKGALGTVLRLGISFGAIALIVFFLRDEIGEAIAILRTEVEWKWFFLAILGYFLANVILTTRLLNIFKVHDIIMSFRECLHLVFTGLFFNLFPFLVSFLNVSKSGVIIFCTFRRDQKPFLA